MRVINRSWCVVLLCLAGQVCAQEAGLSVHSNPAGAQVIVSGDAQLAGITPTHFQQPLIGQYKVTIKKSGYESSTKRVLLDPTKAVTVEAQLSPKTPMKAAMRSLFIPGWGQYYSEKKPKAYIFAASTLVAGSAFLIIDSHFQKKLDEYTDIQKEYDNAKTDERRDFLRPQVTDAQNEAYDAENVRRASIGVFAGIWALNVLDAIFFFPHKQEEGTSNPDGKSLSIVPMSDFKTVGVKFHVAF